MREPALDVFAHLDGALVEERLAVVEEVDAAERRARFVDDPLEQIEVEHAGLARAGDARLRVRSTPARTRCCRRRCISMYSRDGQRRHASRSRCGGCSSFVERQLQRAVAAELRAAAVEILSRGAEPSRPSRRRRRRSSARRRARAGRTGSAQPQTRRPSQSSTIVLHGQLHVNRVARKLRATRRGQTSFGSFFMQAPRRSFS